MGDGEGIFHIMKKTLLAILTIFIMVGCSSYKYGAGEENVQKSNLTFALVKSKIIKGETTQDEIIKLFGAPNLITKNRNNNEVWSYNRMSAVSKGGSNTFLFGERASVSSSNQSFDLIITYDDKNIVQDYSVITTSY